MTRIAFTFLTNGSVASRVYLAMLHQKGFDPELIILLTRGGGPRFKFLASILGEKITWKIFHIIVFIQKLKEFLHYLKIRPLGENLLNGFGLTLSDVNSVLNKYSTRTMKLRVTSINDYKLYTWFRDNGVRVVLFTGGGILKKNLLSLKNVKFMHIHPGLCPDIRGADCFFWSILLRGKPGYTVFWMNEGIDTGDIIHTREFRDLPVFTMSRRFDDIAIYRALLEFFDPALRVETLIEMFDLLITNSPDVKIDLFDLQGEVQVHGVGRTFHFMHLNIVSYAIQKFRKLN